MIKRMIGIALIVLGDVGLIVGLTADELGLGAVPQAIGYKQISLVVAAIVVQLVGILVSQMESKARA